MNRIPFVKMSGSGNDFIIIDNRESRVAGDAKTLAAQLCRRKMSVGADGLILVEASDAADFRWRFFNSDGSVAEMCGNGARCVARFAHRLGICGPDLAFETQVGVVRARVTGDRVKVTLPKPTALSLDYDIDLEQGPLSISSVNTGVPHVVISGLDPETVDLAAIGREVRFHPRFAPAGTNVNIVSVDSTGTLHIRTYERGVEDETLSCGTGTVAAAVVSVRRGEVRSPVRVHTRSGEVLTVYVAGEGADSLDVSLEGGARFIYEGALMEDAWSA